MTGVQTCALPILPGVSRSQIQRLLSEGLIQVNGRSVKPSHRVVSGEKIQVELLDPAAPEIKGEKIPLRILYEDPDLLLVDKPAGLVVHPAPGHPSGTLVNGLIGHTKKLSSVAGFFKPGIVHRLDKETSGLLVVAKNDQTHRDLGRQFAAREVRRTYIAFVHGIVQQDEGTIEAPIGRHPIKRQQMAIRYGSGREAVTRYRVLERFSTSTVLELVPQTGRTHQLRVHLAHLGHPILGDARYGIRFGLKRQALHAHKLGFQHPTKKRWVEFTSPVPRDLMAAKRLLKLRKK